MKRYLLIATISLVSTLSVQAQQRLASNVTVSAQSPIVRFYPNPATTQISFDFQRSYERGYSLQIYNFLGRKMTEQSNVNERTSINLTDYPRGVYIYKLFDKSGRLVESGKFQVSK